jgi:hypothetical protein
MQLPHSLGALAQRRFRLLFTGRTISSFGSSMAEIALAFAVLDIGGPSDLGLVILAREIPIVVLLLIGGVWGDRLPRHLVLAGSDFVRGAAQAATAVLLLTGNASVLSIAVLAAIFGGASAFGRPAYQGLVPQTVPATQLQQANALMGLSFSVVAIAGPAVGAAIVTTTNPGWALWADAMTFLLSSALLLRIDLPRAVRLSGSSMLADFKEGWHEVSSRSWLVSIIVAFAVFQLTYFPALLVLGPYTAKIELGGAGAWGTILAAEAAGALVGGLIALRVRFARPLVAVLLSVVPAAVMLLLLGIAAPLWMMVPVSFVSGAFLAIGGAVWFSTLQEKIPEHALSRVSSFDWFGSVALNPVGYALIGPLSNAIGVGEALLLAGMLNLGSTLAMLLVPSVRALRAGSEAELERREPAVDGRP